MRPCGRQEDTTLTNAVFGMPRGGQVKKVARGDFFFFLPALKPLKIIDRG